VHGERKTAAVDDCPLGKETGNGREGVLCCLAANEICAADPERAVRALVAQGYARSHDIALQLVRGRRNS
jgi:hypothetical protein